MCGIVGVAGNVGVADEKAVRTMLILDTVRGEHSTGIATVRRDKEVRVAKALGNPYELFDTKRFDKAIAGSLKVMIGHNRYATQGAISVRNAHPFQFDNVVGVHNGTVHNHRDLKEGTSFTVDSEAIYNSIDQHGPFETIPKISGAWALVWWDSTAETLNMIRNDQRPLWISVSKNGEKMFWASEPWMIEVACGKANVAIEEPKQIVKDKLLSWKITGNGKLPDAEVHELKGKVYVPHNQGSTYYPPRDTGGVVGTTIKFCVGDIKTGNSHHVRFYELIPEGKNVKGEFRMYVSQHNENMFKPGDMIFGRVSSLTTVGNTGPGHYVISPHTVTVDSFHSNKKDEGEEEEMYLGQHGVFYPASEWNKKYQDCSWCSSPLVGSDVGNEFFGNNEAVCPSCAEMTEVKQYIN